MQIRNAVVHLIALVAITDMSDRRLAPGHATVTAMAQSLRGTGSALTRQLSDSNPSEDVAHQPPCVLLLSAALTVGMSCTGPGDPDAIIDD